MFDWDVTLEKAHRKVVEYAALKREIEQLEAQAAVLLGEIIDGYRIPGDEECELNHDEYGVQIIDEGHFFEDLTCEIAVAHKTSEFLAQRLVGDVTWLVDMLPKCWGMVTSGQAPLWQARRVVQACAYMTPSQCAIVDKMVAPCLGAVNYQRVARMVRAAVALADPHRVVRTQETRARYVSTGADDYDPLTGWVSARVDTADAIFLDATVQLMADKLAANGDTGDRDDRRARALGMLANPAAAVQLIGVHTTRGMDPIPASETDKEAFVQHCKQVVPSFIPRTQVYVHLSSAVITNELELARVEKLGPILVGQIAQLTQGTKVKVTPVVHLDSNSVAVDAYEIPDRIREYTYLRDRHDVFPWSSIESRRLDLDHTIPYRPGLLEQTTPGNLGPLSRRAHRVKTHAGWDLKQPEPGVFEWTTAAGQRVRVDHMGSHCLPALE